MNAGLLKVFGSSGFQHWAMSMRILAEQLNGETLDLEVTAETTMRAVKEQLKGMHTWEDELSRDTTVVELILGDKKVTNEETMEELGLCHGSKVTVVFKKNVVQCSNKRGFGCDLDPEALVVVEIPDSVTEIKDWAFEDCKRVAKVIIPRSVTGILDGAFAFCSSLVSVNIPDSVTWIDDGAFSGCSALTEVTIPHSITHIGVGAFDHCSSLRTASIPHSVTQIAASAFYGCASLVSMTIPDSVTEIEGRAFHDCHQLTLTAPARLLDPQVSNVCKMVAKECVCGR